MARKNSSKTPPSSSFRIIAGRWRGRRFSYPVVDGLRPTPDRMRETLFNWLAPTIDGARCLDLYSGTGALGLEALSRGASTLQWVEKNTSLAAALRAHAKLLDIEQDAVVTDTSVNDYFSYLSNCFDIVFMDPPFRMGLADFTVQQLLAGSWLAPKALVYVETEIDSLPLESLVMRKESRAGQVCGRLYSLP